MDVRHGRGRSNNNNNNRGPPNHRGNATKSCAECNQTLPTALFSKNQLSKERGRCTDCIGKQKAEQTDEGGIQIDEPANDDELTPLKGNLETLMNSQMAVTPEVLFVPPDQACSDRGRPGTCTVVEYVVGDTGKQARSRLHPLLFLRDMSYVGHYRREGVSFAVPHVVIQVPALRNAPPSLVAQVKVGDSVTSSLRVWGFRDCPPTVNIISHGWVFIDDEKSKIARNVAMGCFCAVGVSQRTLPVGRVHPNVRVSLHQAKGQVACSPNNAILNVEPTDDLRRFWIFVRDGTRVEVTLNVLLSREDELDEMQRTLAELSKIGEQTELRHLYSCLSKTTTLQPLIPLCCTHLLEE